MFGQPQQNDLLEEIVSHKQRELKRRKRKRPLDSVQRDAEQASPPRNFFQAVTRPRGQLRVIAEIKRASPSGGLIRSTFEPVSLARLYHEAGAAAISVLTDEKYFQGSLAHIGAVKQAVPVPVLRKDFIMDPYQVYEARAAGADAILLIAECLTEPRMLDLLILATELKMTTLIEVHDLESLIQVKSHVGFPHRSYQLLGINNRNLHDMTTDVEHTLSLLGEVPDTKVLVSESGIKTREDVKRLTKAGVHRILVGEHLMRQDDVGAALRELTGEENE